MTQVPRPQSSRLKVCSEYVVLQREEFHIWEDEESYPVEAGLRWAAARPSVRQSTVFPFCIRCKVVQGILGIILFLKTQEVYFCSGGFASQLWR